MQAAAREILVGDEQFAVIAWKLGFDHATQFSREVAAAFGFAPRELRRSWKYLRAMPAID